MTQTDGADAVDEVLLFPGLKTVEIVTDGTAGRLRAMQYLHKSSVWRIPRTSINILDVKYLFSELSMSI